MYKNKICTWTRVISSAMCWPFPTPAPGWRDKSVVDFYFQNNGTQYFMINGTGRKKKKKRLKSFHFWEKQCVVSCQCRDFFVCLQSSFCFVFTNMTSAMSQSNVLESCISRNERELELDYAKLSSPSKLLASTTIKVYDTEILFYFLLAWSVMNGLRPENFFKSNLRDLLRTKRASFILKWAFIEGCVRVDLKANIFNEIKHFCGSRWFSTLLNKYNQHKRIITIIFCAFYRL